MSLNANDVGPKPFDLADSAKPPADSDLRGFDRDVGGAKRLKLKSIEGNSPGGFDRQKNF